ncbi:MAG: DUF6781 family protein [Campylobacterota bacterium]|nr:DUF6781 family protein [Campylobacterota bacterium]
MIDSMRKMISDDIKKAYESGKMSAQDVKTVVENAVSKVVDSTKEGATDINEVAKVAVVATVTELKSVGSATKEHIDAAVNGTVEGISAHTKAAINDMDMELLKTKYRLEEKKGNLAVHLKDALNGANEASSAFSEEIKADIEDAVTDAKLKSIELLGLMQETIKQSVKVIIDEGKDVEAKVAHITKEATENALSAGRLSAVKTKEVAEAAILAAIEAAEEAGKEVKETTQGAAEGAKQGVVKTIEKVKTKLAEAKDEVEDFVEEDIKQTIEDLEAMNDAFVEALSNSANKVGDVAKEVLDESIDGMKENASQIKESAEDAADAALGYLKERGSQAAYSAKEKVLEAAEVAKEEVIDLSEKMVKIAKGAFSGMIEGAKKAMKKEEEK